MKAIYHIEVIENGEYDFFFDNKAKLLTYWHKNDANWRGEYMSPLFDALKIMVIETDRNDNRFVKKINATLKEIGG